jgi:hypothetical protein
MNVPKSRSIPVEFFHQIMEYREEVVDGVLQGNVYWKKRDDNSVQWNGRYAGKKAGSKNCRGYNITIIKYNNLNCNLQMHTITYILNYNKYPENVIDHIDGNKLNNLISNLEDSSLEDNSNNRGATPNSSSHFRAVFRHRNKWLVRVKAKGKNFYYGYYIDEIEAALKANKVLIEHFGHTKNLRLNDISTGYTNKAYPNMPRHWVPEKVAA